MATNKDKIRASAQKFLQKGQIDKAIREYQRLVEEDPKDVRTLLKIGDLQTRIGSNSEATATYGLVAQFYSEQGFFLKAVAVYKQILKLDGNLIDVNQKLADLYHQLGLMSDAANQYRQIAQLYERDGKVEESLKVLQRMVELDPDNVASRIKLAEVYAKQNMLEEARSEFAKAAAYLKAAHRVDDYVKVAERIIHFDPSDLRTTKELANIYIQKGDARRALAKLQVCFKANPKDVETLNLLAVAFKDLDQPAKTVSVYRELARIHEAARDVPSLQGVMRKILAIEPDDAEAKRLLDGTGGAGPPPMRSPSEGPPQRRPSTEMSQQQVAQAQALAMPARRVTGEMSPAQVAAVQAVMGQTRRATGEISPAQVAAMEQVASGRRATSDVSPAQLAQSQQSAAPRPTGEVRETIPAPLPDNALGRIVPAHKAVAVGPESPVREVDRRATPVEEEIEIDTDFDDDTATLEDDGLSDQTRETISRILVEAEVYIKYGLKQKAIEHLRKVFALAPDHRESRVRYKALLIDTGAVDEAVQTLLGMAAAAFEGGDRQSAKEDLEELLTLEPGHRRARELLLKIDPSATMPAVVAEIDDVDVAEVEIDTDDDLSIEADDGDYVPTVVARHEPAAQVLTYEPSQAAAEIDLDADDEPPPIADEHEIEIEASLDDDEGITVEVGEDDDAISAPEPMLATNEALPSEFSDDIPAELELEGAPGFELDDEPTPAPAPAPAPAPPQPNVEAAPVASKAPAPATPVKPATPKKISVLDDELDALINSAVPTKGPAKADKAAETKAAEAKAAEAKAADEKRRADEAAAAKRAAEQADAKRIADAKATEAKRVADEAEAKRAAEAEAAQARAAEERRAAETEAAPAEAETAATSAPADLSSEIAELGFYLEQGLDDEARDTLATLLADHPNHPALLAFQAKLDGSVAPAPHSEKTAPDDYEPEPEMLIGGDLATDIAFDLSSAAADTDLQVSLDDVFDEFKRGVAQSVDDTDYATHYDLGIAYKEMALLDDAIREFELAARDPSRAIGALTMMGLCALQLSDTEHALDYFLRGLNHESVTPQEAMALRYEIGVAYESAGKPGEAAKFYEKVLEWDEGFRDVQQRLAAARENDDGHAISGDLDELLSETEAERNSRSKISYV